MKNPDDGLWIVMRTLCVCDLFTILEYTRWESYNLLFTVRHMHSSDRLSHFEMGLTRLHDFCQFKCQIKGFAAKEMDANTLSQMKKKKSFPIHTDTHFYLKCLKCENVHSKWKSICHLRLSDSLLPVHLQLLHSSRFYKCKAPLSAAAFFLFPYFISSTRLWSQKRLELDSGDPCL